MATQRRKSRGRKRQTDDLPLVDGGDLTRGEIIDILEELARTGGASSKIQAIRLLKDMSEDESGPTAAGFDALDGDDEVSVKRRARAS